MTSKIMTSKISSPGPLAACLACLGLLAALYIAFPLANHTEAEDSLVYARLVATGEAGAHPNHLLYEPIAAALIGVLRALGYEGDVMRPMQAMSTLAALAVLAMVFQLVRTATPSVAGASATTLICGLSSSFWQYAIAADTYMVPLAFAFGCLVVLRRRRARLGPMAGREIGAGTASPPLRSGELVLLGALAALAVLFHQLYVFAGVLIGVVLLAERVPAASGRLRPDALAPAAVFHLVFGGLVLGVYAGAWALQTNAGDFLDWTKGHAGHGLWDPPSATTPLEAIAASTSALMSPNVLFAFAPSAEFLAAVFGGKALVEERFLAEVAITPARAAFVLAGIAMGAIGLVVLALGRGGALRAAPPRPRAVRWLESAVLVPFLVVFVVLTCLWEAINREFWIHILAVATLVAGMRISWSVALQRRAAFCVAGAFLVVNLLSAVEPSSRPEADYWRRVNAPVFERLGANDVLLTECSWLCVSYIRHYTGATVMVASSVAPETVAASLATGRTIYVSSLVASGLARANPMRQKALSDLIPSLDHLAGRAVDPLEQTIYRLDEGGALSHLGHGP